jgi:DNA repair photolyase
MDVELLVVGGAEPPRATIYDLEGFEPRVIDRAYLTALGVRVAPSDETVAALERGSRLLVERLRRRVLLPRPVVEVARIDPRESLPVHNYTGACPTSTYEVNPMTGCHVGCLYCLVSDGVHEARPVLYANYPELLERVLEEKLGERCFYYDSPKTEAFQAPTLASGVAHEILRVFVRHFARHPESKARLFVASKAGAAELRVEHEGESVLDLFARLAGRMQFNTSVSIMPPSLRALLEPHAAPIADRLEAVRLCRAGGVLARAALVQPILIPSLTDEACDAFFARLAAAGIESFKPELLTVCMENLAVVGQVLGHVDRDMERRLYEAYIAPENADHRKQRARTAPDRELSRAALRQLVAAARRHGIDATVCQWVRRELAVSESFIPTISAAGYQCLGYQTRLFDDPCGEGPR